MKKLISEDAFKEIIRAEVARQLRSIRKSLQSANAGEFQPVDQAEESAKTEPVNSASASV